MINNIKDKRLHIKPPRTNQEFHFKCGKNNKISVMNDKMEPARFKNDKSKNSKFNNLREERDVGRPVKRVIEAEMAEMSDRPAVTGWAIKTFEMD